MTLKTSILLIIASIIIGLFGALPMILNRDDSWLAIGLIVSNVLFILGIVGLIKSHSKKSKI